MTMQSLFLIARINGARVAIHSDFVESVVRIQDIVPIPRCDPIVVGLFALRSRVLTLIDSQFFVTGITQPFQPGALAIVAEVSGQQFGFLVESVEDAITIDLAKIEKNITPPREWSGIASGLVEVSGEIAIIIDPSPLIDVKKAIAA